MCVCIYIYTCIYIYIYIYIYTQFHVTNFHCQLNKLYNKTTTPYYVIYLVKDW